MYTAPFIWIPSSKCQIEEKGSSYTCYDRFDVRSIEIIDGNIVSLEIVNEKTGNLVYEWSKKKVDKAKEPVKEPDKEKEALAAGQEKIGKVKQKALEEYFKKLNVNAKEVLDSYGAKTYADLTEDAHFDILRRLKAAEEKIERDNKVITMKEIKALLEKVNSSGINIDKLLALYKVDNFKVLTYKQYDNINKNWEKILEVCK